ncbi:ABC transporter ATP-binding protein [Algiphilus sp.]|uniref:ABC transporter ATP-binding protein n=1 Tax=Algiphilus sp. TaxID=1872431 RepID=UPI0032EB5567
MNAPLLSIEGLDVRFAADGGELRALHGVDLEVAAGEVVGLVGESGCGKSVTASAVLRLLPEPPARVAAGQIRFDGRDLLSLSPRALRRLRGPEIAMIFQEPMTALNPVFTIGSQMTDVLRRHERMSRRAARARAVDWLHRVGIPAPEQRLSAYPHQLSGGMRQRVMIAMALSCRPRLLIADEPTTALDVTIQAQVLELMTELVRAEGVSMLLITHDMGVVAETCDRVHVMYCGRVVEEAPVKALFAAPRHPYTAGLLACLPRVGADRTRSLPTIPGKVPELHALPEGCAFADRCKNVQADCRSAPPPLRRMGNTRVACLHPEPV